MQLVIVDRDALLEAGDCAASAEDPWESVPGGLEALARLSGAGFRLVVVCNQPDLGRKNFSIETLNALHHRLQHEMLEAGGSLDAVFFCSCHPSEACDCLMPNPGMLLEIGSRLRISLDGVPVIAGSPTTVQAARAAGARPIQVAPGEQAAQTRASNEPVERYPDLGAAVDGLLAEIASA